MHIHFLRTMLCFHCINCVSHEKLKNVMLFYMHRITKLNELLKLWKGWSYSHFRFILGARARARIVARAQRPQSIAATTLTEGRVHEIQSKTLKSKFQTSRKKRKSAPLINDRAEALLYRAHMEGGIFPLKLLTLRISTNKAKTEGSFVEVKKGMKKENFTISSSEKLASLDFLSLDKKTLPNLLWRCIDQPFQAHQKRTVKVINMVQPFKPTKKKYTRSK